MSIEVFSKQQFEQALPHRWECLGLVDGEYAYIMPINPDIFIMIRSSVDSSGYCAETGQDSIRAWLVNADYHPLGSKISKYTTRLPGWDNRLKDVLRQLWGMAHFAKYCADCHTPMGCFKVKKPGPNKGRIFKKCTRCGNHFEWMEDKNGNP